MTTTVLAPQDPTVLLSIGDLARETGLTPPVIRMWEARYGFPEAIRLESGHRRYSADQIALVRQVVRRRDAGIRLETAIAEARASVSPDTPSVFATLRSRHPRLLPYRLRKSTLLALSWALEDEVCAIAERPLLFGAFQRERYWAPSAARWGELARVARTAMVFADFPEIVGDGAERTPVRVPLAPDAPMQREWVVVCDAADRSACLSAWELPGQQSTPEPERIFEAVWTVEPRAVRDAARVCARVAAEAGVSSAAPVQFALADEPTAQLADPVAATALFNRVIAYVDRFAG